MGSMDSPIGLIAGGGHLPVITARGIRAAGGRVACVGLRGQFDPQLPHLCDEFATVGVLRMGAWIRSLRQWGVGQAVMVGKVQKTTMYDPLRILRMLPDLRTIRMWYSIRHDRRPARVLTAVADILADEGIELVDSTRYIPEAMADQGVMTRRQPTAGQMTDVTFGLPLVVRLSELDIGQAIAVKGGDVIAVEAIEGTDAMIERAGKLCPSGGWTLIKTARAGHDMRFDVPTVGVGTIQMLHNCGGSCLALGAGRVILVDKPQVLELADKLKIAVVGV